MVQITTCIEIYDRKYELICTSFDQHEEQMQKLIRRIAKEKLDREMAQELEDREQQNIDLEEAFARN